MGVDTCTDMCADVYTGTPVDMCMDTCMDVCRDTWRALSQVTHGGHNSITIQGHDYVPGTAAGRSRRCCRRSRDGSRACEARSPHPSTGRAASRCTPRGTMPAAEHSIEPALDRTSIRSNQHWATGHETCSSYFQPLCLSSDSTCPMDRVYTHAYTHVHTLICTYWPTYKPAPDPWSPGLPGIIMSSERSAHAETKKKSAARKLVRAEHRVRLARP